MKNSSLLFRQKASPQNLISLLSPVPRQFKAPTATIRMQALLSRSAPSTLTKAPRRSPALSSQRATATAMAIASRRRPAVGLTSSSSFLRGLLPLPPRPSSIRRRRRPPPFLSLCVQAVSSRRWRWDDSEDAVRAYASLAAVLAAGAAAAALDVPNASLPYFVGLVRFISLWRE